MEKEKIEKGIENVNGLIMEFQNAVDSLTEIKELLYAILEDEGPMHWIKSHGYHYCPNCKKVFNDERHIVVNYNHCPSCGQRLYYPKYEGAENEN